MRTAVAIMLVPVLAGAAAPAAAPGDSAYSAIVDRPLFDPTRHRYIPPPPPPPAPVPKPAPVAPPPPAPLRVALVGVVTGGDRPIALLRGNDGQVLRLTKGESIDGWLIVAIADRSVDIERNGVRQSLTLPEPTGPNP